MKILITGAAGFIGYSLANQLLNNKKNIIFGIDNFSKYSGRDIKKLRIDILKKSKNFKFYKIDINNKNKIENLFKKNLFDIVVHLAAEVGVRYSIIRPDKYIKTNINGFFNIIESLKYNEPKKFLFASSSSVYGDCKLFPLKETQNLYPKNIYALSKKNNEEIADIYSKKYKTKFIALRFFTVFGELGRPDMFFFKLLFTAFKNKKLYVNNSGNHYRDFTYIKDVINILTKLILVKFSIKYQVLNICSSRPIYLKEFIRISEKFSKKIDIINVPAHPADVYKTHGSNKKLLGLIKNIKFTRLENAIKNSIISYKKYKIFDQKN
jgi:UDP-glucuronate 4-epimerase